MARRKRPARRASASDDTPSPGARLRLWLRSFLPFAVILILDPFGCSQVADHYSEQILLRLVAPFHSGARAGRGYDATPGQQKVAVIMIDQDWIEEIANTSTAVWPPQRSDQIAQILHPILEQGAVAVLLDYTFSGEPAAPAFGAASGFDLESPAAIRGQLEDERRHHSSISPNDGRPQPQRPRIFLGSKPLFPGTDRDCKVPRITAQDLAAADDVAPSLRNWPHADEASDVEVVTLRRYDPDHYPLLTYRVGGNDVGCHDIDGSGAGDYLASPAWALFTTWCERERPGNALCRAARRRPAYRPDRQPDPRASYSLYAGGPMLGGSLAPVWPGFRSPAQRRYDAALIARTAAAPRDHADDLARRIARCERRGWGPIAPSVALAVDLFWSKLWRADAALETEPCRYGVDVIPIRALQALVEDGQRPLDGKYVLVGLDVESVHDVTQSPLYGDVPGVLLHAVVLENLISNGPNFLSDRTVLGGLSATMITLLLGVLLSLLAVVPAIAHRIAQVVAQAHLRRRFPHGWALATGLAAALIAVGVPLTIGLILSFPGGMAPVNWVSLIPAMLWLIELVLDANERAFRARETVFRAGSAAARRAWRTGFFVPAAVVVVVALLLAIRNG